MKGINEQRQSYDYEYTDQKGVGYSGSTMHENDDDAISYFRSLEEGGGIKMRSLRNPRGRPIWNDCRYGRTRLPF